MSYDTINRLNCIKTIICQGRSSYVGLFCLVQNNQLFIFLNIYHEILTSGKLAILKKRMHTTFIFQPKHTQSFEKMLLEKTIFIQTNFGKLSLENLFLEKYSLERSKHTHTS